MIKPLPLFLILLFLTVGRAVAADDEMLPDAILYPERKAGHIMVVDKTEQLLYLYRHDETGQVFLERVVQCSTGANKGDKIVEGDKKTPNGFYIFNQKLLPRELPAIYGTLAYPTDYPNFWDKSQGRGGYGIWIHGINKPLVDYDSNGCVELENADIAKMEELIRLFDTPLIIYESLSQAPVGELRAEADQILKFLATWGKAWVNKDYQTYRSLYDPEFVNSDGRSYAGWMTHKENVGRNYERIQVEIRNLRIFRHRDVITAMFTQDYRGDDRFTSVGLKYLYLKKSGSGYKIVGEAFRDLPETDTHKWLTAAEKRRALETPPLQAAKATRPDHGQNEPESSRVSVEVRSIAQILNQDEASLTANGAFGQAGLEDQTPAEARAEAQALAEAETRAQEEAEARAKVQQAEAEAAARAQEEADARARAQAEVEAAARARVEAQAIARIEAEAQDRARAEAQATAEAEARTRAQFQAARAQAEALAQAEARAKAETEAEVRALNAAEESIKQELVELVRQWAEAWTRRDVATYFGFYHPDFYYQAKNLNLDGFISYRRVLIEDAYQIEVKLSNFEVRLGGDTARVAFRQDYRSDQVRDRGRKTLILKKTGSGWKILAETWKAV